MVPNGWKHSTIADISNTTMGFAFKSSDFVKDGVPLIRMGNLYQNQLQLDRNPVFLPHHYISEYEKFVLRSGDLVMSMTGTMGKRDYGFTVQIPNHSPECLLNQRVMKFDANRNSCKEFLLNLLKSEYVLDRLYSFPGGTKQANLSAKQVGDIPILLPPLPEQRKIAKILSTWDKAITTTERLIATSQQQKKALMQQLLTGKKRLVNPDTGMVFEGDWEEVKLGDVLTKISNGLTYDSKATQGLPVSRIETISTGKVNHAKVGYAPNDEKTIKFKLQFGDILYSHINSLEHIGRVAYFLDDKDLYHGMNLLLLRASKDADSKFIYFMLSSSLGKEFARSHAKSAVNQASISTTDLKGFKAKLPGLGEQQKIASVLTGADKEIELLETKLAHLKEEKKALMQQLLTGKRRVKVETTEAA